MWSNNAHTGGNVYSTLTPRPNRRISPSSAVSSRLTPRVSHVTQFDRSSKLPQDKLDAIWDVSDRSAETWAKLPHRVDTRFMGFYPFLPLQLVTKTSDSVIGNAKFIQELKACPWYNFHVLTQITVSRVLCVRVSARYLQ